MAVDVSTKINTKTKKFYYLHIRRQLSFLKFKIYNIYEYKYN